MTCLVFPLWSSNPFTKILKQQNGFIKYLYFLLLILFRYLINLYLFAGPSFGPPSESLQIKGRTIEAQIQSLHDDIFKAAGFEVIKFTRLPYLCEGDLHNDFFVLNDIVFVLKKII